LALPVRVSEQAQTPYRPSRSALIAEAVEAGVDSISSEATGCLEPTPGDLADVARVTSAMEALVAKYDLDAVSLRCFDLLVSRETTGCLALSALTDAGVMAGCEGDLVSTVGMLWANLLTGELPWMANPAELDVAANTLKLAHCTIARGMLERYRLRSHFESGMGVGIQGDLPLGPVTLIRIGGAEMEALWVAEGAVVGRGDAENLCRTQVDRRPCQRLRERPAAHAVGEPRRDDPRPPCGAPD